MWKKLADKYRNDALYRAAIDVLADRYDDGMAEYEHLSVNHSAKQFVDGMAHTNSIESVWAVLKRGFYGIYHSFSQKHLQRYINEFTYRLNEGNVRAQTMDRIEAILRRTNDKRFTYRQIVA
jgi:hypothetical protein